MLNVCRRVGKNRECRPFQSTPGLWLDDQDSHHVSHRLFLTTKCPLLFVYFFNFNPILKELIFRCFVFVFCSICKHNTVSLFMRDAGPCNRLWHWQQRTWTYWASSGMRIGWGRLWRPPHRKVAGGTGSGRSVRKTGHMAPSVTSGCCSSDCFLETYTYIHIYIHTYVHIQTERGGEKENWAGYL